MYKYKYFFFVYLGTIGKACMSCWRYSYSSVTYKKLKQFEHMQKDTFKNIKPWFFKFQGILGLQPPKQKVILEWKYCVRISHAKTG